MALEVFLFDVVLSTALAALAWLRLNNPRRPCWAFALVVWTAAVAAGSRSIGALGSSGLFRTSELTLASLFSSGCLLSVEFAVRKAPAAQAA